MSFQYLAGPAIDEKRLKLDVIFDKMENGPDLIEAPEPNNVISAPSEMMNDDLDVSLYRPLLHPIQLISDGNGLMLLFGS